MGLDWRPLNKPKKGFEERYQQIFRIVNGIENLPTLSFWDKLIGKRAVTINSLVEEFIDISIPSYETIKAPQVGFDEVANNWIKAKYQQTNKTISENEFLKQHLGYYVIELAKEKDGVPVYSSIGQDENVFRAQFLLSCKDIMGDDLFQDAYVSKLAQETLHFGEQLMSIGDKYANEHNLTYLKQQKVPPEVEEDDAIESKIHILYSAAKWLIFYGKNGHGFEADY